MKEWSVLKDFIPEKSKFLDVGCGSGHNMFLAKEEKKCDVFGVDPEPGMHGYGRFVKINEFEEGKISKGGADSLNFQDNYFDVIFCSHVLEHIQNKEESLKEMRRVLSPNGILIIGMPTSTMAKIALFSNLIFKFHINVLFFITSLGSRESKDRFRQIWLNKSHSYPIAKTALYDLYFYKKSNWRRIVSEYFNVMEEPVMYLYCFPDYKLKWIPMHKNKFLSSSVFFICSKK